MPAPHASLVVGFALWSNVKLKGKETGWGGEEEGKEFREEEAEGNGLLLGKGKQGRRFLVYIPREVVKEGLGG